jgi:hypothetical protein
MVEFGLVLIIAGFVFIGYAGIKNKLGYEF